MLEQLQFVWQIFQNAKVFHFSYLEQLFAKLRRGGLVKSVRGPGGGYRLALPTDQISIGMVISAVNENINVTRCLGKGNCKGGVECLTHTLWQDLSDRNF